MHEGRFGILSACLIGLVVLSYPQNLWGQEERIITPDEVRRITQPGWLYPLRVLSYPHRLITSGMEKGLISFEEHRFLERWRSYLDWLNRRGIAPMFGGTGEGTGIGGGFSKTAGLATRDKLGLSVYLTSTNYEEFDLFWKQPLGRSTLYWEGSYQWRPRENFYGLGHNSLTGQRTSFALRQSWTGLRFEVVPNPWWQTGVEYKWAWLKALPGTAPGISAPDVYFPDLPGYQTLIRLRSLGAYLSLNGLRKEYQLGGSLLLGASYQDGMGESKLKYYSYEVRMKGSLPIASDRSALVGHANLEFSRTSGGSDSIPFYLLPHIGGSSTLRGFPLDRFYGTNLFLLSLEYRYRLHPNIEAIPFFDEGQIFDRTSDLKWLNWHRNYGLAFRYRAGAEKRTVLRLEFGHSSEGFQLHLSFGDRDRRPLRGPIRYGAYKP